MIQTDISSPSAVAFPRKKPGPQTEQASVSGNSLEHTAACSTQSAWNAHAVQVSDMPSPDMSVW